MDFDPPLTEARLIRRYKRFLADVRFTAEAEDKPGADAVPPADGADDDVVTVHCPNSGAMLGVAPPGARCWLSQSPNPKRKHAWTLEVVEADGVCVGINTMAPNRLAAEALSRDAIAELAGYGVHRREVRYHEDSRIDLLLESADRPPAYVEVKNVHLRRRDRLAEFPDSVTARGAKHLRALADMARADARAVMLFVVQRDDCDAFALADDIDHAYAAAFREARAAGVEALAYACAVSPQAIHLTRPLPMIGE